MGLYVGDALPLPLWGRGMPVLPPEPPPPAGFAITALSATNLSAGQTLTITGGDFGTSAGTVSFGERPNVKGWGPYTRTATILSWGRTTITAQVPSMAPGKAGYPHTYQPVYVTVGGQLTNSYDFFLTPSTTISGQSYTEVTRNGYNNILYDGCTFVQTRSLAYDEGASAMLINGPTNCVTFHNCNFSSNCNGSTINQLFADEVRDIVFSDCTWGYCDRMAFECTARYGSINYIRVGIRGGSVYPAGSEAISYDGNEIPTYCFVKDLTIRGGGTSTSGHEWSNRWGHGLEFNGPTYCMAQNVTINGVRLFSINTNGITNEDCHWVFDNVNCARDVVDPGMTRALSSSGRNGLMLGMCYAHFENCRFHHGSPGFNNMHLGYELGGRPSSHNRFINCTWLGSNVGVSEYGGSTDNYVIP